jgi:hypothetical protein
MVAQASRGLSAGNVNPQFPFTNSPFLTQLQNASNASLATRSFADRSQNYRVSSSGDAETIAASITGAQQNRYRDLIQPIERKTLKDLMDPKFAAKAADAAVGTVDQSIKDTAGMELRNAQRYGLQVTADQKAEIARHSAIENSLNRAGAYNQTRQFVKELQTQGMIDATQIGRNIAGQAMQSSTQAAGLQSARKKANAQAEAANEAQTYQTLATATALAMSIAFL